MVDKEKFVSEMLAYLASLDNTVNNEWYDTDRNIHRVGVHGFYDWLFAEDQAKAARRELYLTLKAEFDERE